MNKRKRKKKQSYFEQLKDEPVFVGKKPIKDRRAHGVSYCKPFYVAGLFWFLTLFSWGGAGYGIYFFYQEINLKGMQLCAILLGIHLLTLMICFLLRKTVRCPLCRAHTFVDGRSKKHDKAFRIRPFSFGSTSCITCVFLRCFRCQHCGTPFVMKKHKDHQRSLKKAIAK